MSKYKHYTYRITWSEEDQEYLGLCAEFPSLSYLAKDQATTLNRIVQLVRSVIQDMEENGETNLLLLHKKTRDIRQQHPH